MDHFTNRELGVLLVAVGTVMVTRDLSAPAVLAGGHHSELQGLMAESGVPHERAAQLLEVSRYVHFCSYFRGYQEGLLHSSDQPPPVPAVPPARVSPWCDFLGTPIVEGATIAQSSGEKGRVVFLGSEGAKPEEQWAVIDEETMAVSRLHPITETVCYVVKKGS